MPARHTRTYRADRRNRARLARRQTSYQFRTVSDATEEGPLNANGGRPLIPRRVRIKTSPKVYRGGNIPGGLRRRMDRGEFMSSAF